MRYRLLTTVIATFTALTQLSGAAVVWAQGAKLDKAPENSNADVAMWIGFVLMACVIGASMISSKRGHQD